MTRIGVWNCHVTDAPAFYLEALRGAGAEPVLVDPAAAEAVDPPSFDGILLTGGNDIPARLYGELPHESEEPLADAVAEGAIAAVQAASSARTPLLGICLGCQVIAVARGGKLVADLPRMGETIHKRTTPGEVRRHRVSIAPGSRLAAFLGATEVDTVTSHHQAVRDGAAGRGLAVVAWAPDGVIEAVEDPALPFFVGVQWHPERQAAEPHAAALFAAFVAAARSRR